jgi:3-hydroxybutyrate dehydrogenase
MPKGKVAVITGSTQGLGYATAEKLAAAGCNVVLNGFGDAAEIEARRKRLEETYKVVALHHRADVGVPEQVADLVSSTQSRFGTLDILVNNAVVRHFAPIEEFKPEDWERGLAVNLSSAFHTVRLALPGMRKNGFGRIVNIASIYSLIGATNRIDYVTTKTALLGFTRAVALETATDNITCNAICPGTTTTPAIEQRLTEFAAKEGLSRDEAMKSFMASRQPTGRFVAPEGVGALVAFLCSAAAADITGAALPVDGAWSVH